MDWVAIRETLTHLLEQAVRRCATVRNPVAGTRFLITAELPLPQPRSTTIAELANWVDHCQAERLVLWRPPESSSAWCACGELLSAEGVADEAWSACQMSINAAVAAIDYVVRAQWREQDDDFELTFGGVEDIRWFGGTAFESRDHAGVWHEWPSAWFFTPQFEYSVTPDQATLRASILYTHDTGLTAQQVAANAREQFGAYFLSSPERREAAFPAGTNQFEGESVNDGERIDADREKYESAVRQSARDIANGRYEKLVLARSEPMAISDSLSLGDTVADLARHYPDAFVFAIRRGNDVFLGASPERLVAVSNGEVSIDCLAGTSARGQTRIEDEKLARELLESSKNLQEHAVVLRWIIECLDATADDVQHATLPVIRKLENVQHLFTPVTARLRKSVRLLDLVRQLHPTPAVAGRPRDVVLPIIREREQVDRGWYGGAVGVMEGCNNGEFCVAIRCGLVTNHTANLYAGAGIMKDSIAVEEWDETVVKMQAMKRVLTDPSRVSTQGKVTADERKGSVQ